MRRILAILVLFVLSVIISCGGTTKPPVPPVCDPWQVLVGGVCVTPAFCGDGDCAGFETPDTCPADCKIEPPPPPPPPPPDPTRWYTFGMYSISSHAHKLDWEGKIIPDLLKTNFTGLSIHWMSPWGQNDRKAPGKTYPAEQFYFFPYKNGVFDLKGTNQEWVDTFDRVVRALLKANRDHKICIWDRYFALGKSWSKYIKVHPFRNNNIGVKWSEDKQLFNSWMGGNTFTWIKWDDIPGTHARVQNWKPVGQIGDALFRQATTMLDIIAKAMKDIPDGRIAIKPFNEQHSGSTDRHEIMQWLQAEGKKRGLVPSKRFFWIYDLGIHEANEAEFIKRFKGGRTVDAGNPNSFIRDAKLELHSVGERYHAKDFIGWGGKKSEMVLSTDGVPKGLNKAACQELWEEEEDVPYGDCKQEEADVPFVFDNKNMLKNWDLALPHHARYLQ